MKQMNIALMGTWKKIAKAKFLLAVVIMAMILQTEAGRDMPLPANAKDEVYSPQSLLGLGGLPFFGLPLPLFKPPWLGGCCAGLLPFLAAPKAGAPALNNANEGDGNALDRTP